MALGKPSRATWIGSFYKRKRSNDYRNPKTGEIKSSPTGTKLGREVRYGHDYGQDSQVSSKKKYNEKKKRFEVLP